jgi:hypothetical protein
MEQKGTTLVAFKTKTDCHSFPIRTRSKSELLQIKQALFLRKVELQEKRWLEKKKAVANAMLDEERIPQLAANASNGSNNQQQQQQQQQQQLQLQQQHAQPQGDQSDSNGNGSGDDSQFRNSSGQSIQLQLPGQGQQSFSSNALEVSNAWSGEKYTKGIKYVMNTWESPPPLATPLVTSSESQVDGGGSITSRNASAGNAGGNANANANNNSNSAIPHTGGEGNDVSDPLDTNASSSAPSSSSGIGNATASTGANVTSAGSTSSSSSSLSSSSTDLEVVESWDAAFPPDLLFHPCSVTSQAQQKLQIVLLQVRVDKLRRQFNKSFFDLYESKKRDIENVREKNKRIKEIQKELMSNDAVFRLLSEPSLHVLELPHLVLQVDDSEITAKKYLTKAERLAKEKREEEERLARLNQDDGPERALQDFMFGTLESKNKIFGAELVRESWMNELTQEEMTDEQKTEYTMFLAKEKKMKQDQESRRKLLMTEVGKIKNEINDVYKQFDRKLDNLIEARIKACKVIFLNELALLHLQNDILRQEQQLYETQQLHLQMNDLAQERAETVRRSSEFRFELEALQSKLNGLVQKDKDIERQFKKEFQDAGEHFDLLFNSFKQRRNKIVSPEEQQKMERMQMLSTLKLSSPVPKSLAGDGVDAMTYGDFSIVHQASFDQRTPEQIVSWMNPVNNNNNSNSNLNATAAIKTTTPATLAAVVSNAAAAAAAASANASASTKPTLTQTHMEMLQNELKAFNESFSMFPKKLITPYKDKTNIEALNHSLLNKLNKDNSKETIQHKSDSQDLIKHVSTDHKSTASEWAKYYAPSLAFFPPDLPVEIRDRFLRRRKAQWDRECELAMLNERIAHVSAKLSLSLQAEQDIENEMNVTSQFAFRLGQHARTAMLNSELYFKMKQGILEWSDTDRITTYDLDDGGADSISEHKKENGNGNGNGNSLVQVSRQLVESINAAVVKHGTEKATLLREMMKSKTATHMLRLQKKRLTIEHADATDLTTEVQLLRVTKHMQHLIKMGGADNQLSLDLKRMHRKVNFLTDSMLEQTQSKKAVLNTIRHHSHTFALENNRLRDTYESLNASVQQRIGMSAIAQGVDGKVKVKSDKDNAEAKAIKTSSSNSKLEKKGQDDDDDDDDQEDKEGDDAEMNKLNQEDELKQKITFAPKGFHNETQTFSDGSSMTLQMPNIVEDAGRKKRMHDLVTRRKLVDLAKLQSTEILYLRGQVDKLRRKTFASFANVSHAAALGASASTSSHLGLQSPSSQSNNSRSPSSASHLQLPFNPSNTSKILKSMSQQHQQPQTPSQRSTSAASGSIRHEFGGGGYNRTSVSAGGVRSYSSASNVSSNGAGSRPATSASQFVGRNGNGNGNGNTLGGASGLHFPSMPTTSSPSGHHFPGMLLPNDEHGSSLPRPKTSVGMYSGISSSSPSSSSSSSSSSLSSAVSKGLRNGNGSAQQSPFTQLPNLPMGPDNALYGSAIRNGAKSAMK